MEEWDQLLGIIGIAKKADRKLGSFRVLEMNGAWRNAQVAGWGGFGQPMDG